MMAAATGVLTMEQRAAATQMGAVLVLAGAGTGKTKTKTKTLTAAFVHRIQVRGIAASRVLAVTFTNKAASEMAGRIRVALDGHAAQHWIGTFHGLGPRQLRSEPEIAGLRPGFDVLDADDSRRIVKRVLKAMNLVADGERCATGRDPLKALCNRLSKFKDDLVTPEDAPARVEAVIADARRLDLPIDPDDLRASARVYDAYQRTLRDANAADFGDLLLLARARHAGKPVLPRAMGQPVRLRARRRVSGREPRPIHLDQTAGGRARGGVRGRRRRPGHVWLA